MSGLLSVIIPHYPGLRETDDALERCVRSLRGHDEILVIVNDGIGFGAAVNIGFRLAHGDYLCVANNDTVLRSGSLFDLCYQDTVTVPRITPRPRDHLPRSFYCIPRFVYETIGGYDEQFRMGYFEDDDLIRRMMAAQVKIETVPGVLVEHRHGGGTTMSQLDPDKWFEQNKKLFVAKWGEKSLFP